MSYLSNNQKIFYSTSKSITINFHLKLLLKKISNYRAIGVDRQRSFILGWGRKRSGKNAVSIAAHQDKRFLLLEDGFLRSVRRLDCSLSFVFDEVGIYYDATVPSRLEELILQVLSEDQLIRTQKIICSWRELRLSKYNSLPEYSQPLPDKYVLVVDQVAGDLSIKYGMANHDSFERMLQAAINDNIESTILVKVHPDLLTCQKSGHFNYFKLKTISRVRIISEPCHCVKLIERAQKVYVVTSQVGFEALLWGKQVHCFGMPFYAGWGLTQDELSTPLRRRRVGLTQLANAALVKYPRYVDLESKAECSLESAMHHVALQRQNRLRFNSKLYALQFSRWKKKYLKLFFAGSEIVFIKTMSQLPKGGTLIVWGNKEYNNLSNNLQILRVEDGFLRSAGLGADLIQPQSWVIDERGIYYDSSRVSGLENILQTITLNKGMLLRSKRLREKLISCKITKYNLIGKPWVRPKTNQLIILVPGQVENDASIQFGAPKINKNLDLLKAVRQANPTAYIVYKPHPDVVAGLRRAGKHVSQSSQYYNEIVNNVETESLFKQVDQVHTMTSLMGFEALMRGVSVTCYGQPFYSGWGLTIDRAPINRQKRLLSIDELVAGALILYPTYISRETGLFTTPERVIDELVSWRNQGGSKMPLWRKGLRVVLSFWAQSGLRHQA